MAKQEFKFMDAYRTMVPAAGREVVDARQKSHDKLFSLVSKEIEKRYDLCRLAFQLPYDPATLTEWFEKPVKTFDVQFSTALDKAEAGRIAALLLRDLVWRGTSHYALAVVITSYCGRRVSVGGSELVTAAREALVEAGKERRIVLADKKITLPAGKDLKAELDAINASPTGPAVKAGMEAMANELRGGATRLATSASEAFESLKNDTTRMAEELDMLWWHIGDWSDLLDRPREGFPKQAAAVLSGTELGGLVRQLPGPYGAYGILRRTTGKVSDKKTNLKNVIEAIDAADLKRLARPLPVSALGLFPVHEAINLAAERGPSTWAAAFEQKAPDALGLEVSNYDLAVQSFREKMLIDFDNLGQ